MPSYPDLEKTVGKWCETFADDPKARSKVREKFYRDYDFKAKKSFDYSACELNFLNYQRKRGVLAPLEGHPPGSLWWRNVNLKCLYYAELARALFEHKIELPDLPVPVVKWLKFLNKPTPRSWYRAYNSSFFQSAQLYRAEALDENDIEQLLMNVVIYRLMYAQAVVEKADVFGDVGEYIDDRDNFGVNFQSIMSKFYPRKYPLEDSDQGLILGSVDDEPAFDEEQNGSFADQVEQRLESLSAALFGKEVEREQELVEQDKLNGKAKAFAEQVNVLDHKIILPRLDELYELVAKWNDTPFVTEWCRDGKAIYPAL